jgi:hypothetical protein
MDTTEEHDQQQLDPELLAYHRAEARGGARA